MSRKSAYVGWFGRLNLPQISNEETEVIKLEEFNHSYGRISFKIVRYITRNVPIRWTTVNYVKHPVEWKKSVRSAVIFKLSRNINAERFCEVDLLDLDIPEEFKIEILENLGIVPTWYQKILDIEAKEVEISFHTKQLVLNIDKGRALDDLEKQFNKEHLNILIEITKLKIVQTTKKSVIIRSLFAFPTLGLSFIGFISNKKAINNKEQKNILELKARNLLIKKEKELSALNKDIDYKNYLIDEKNDKTQQKINKLENELDDIHNNDYKFFQDETGFINLRKSLSSVTKFETKGVYVIWNKTKDKYYVGQSKDVYKRLFTQHFNNNDVKNIVFARDWYAGDEFFYYIYELRTKDELDEMEKRLIGEFNSFNGGYNSTAGNK